MHIKLAQNLFSNCADLIGSGSGGRRARRVQKDRRDRFVIHDQQGTRIGACAVLVVGTHTKIMHAIMMIAGTRRE